jgi:hypothetical protein
MDILNRPTLRPSITPLEPWPAHDGHPFTPSTDGPAGGPAPIPEERPIDLYDVGGALEHAQRVLPDHELSATVLHAEAEGRRGGWGEAGRWLFGVIAVGVIAVVGLRDIRFLPIALLLVTMFAIPIMLAGVWTVHDRDERKDIMDQLHTRAGHPPVRPSGRIPADEGPLPDNRDAHPIPSSTFQSPPVARHDPRP